MIRTLLFLIPFSFSFSGAFAQIALEKSDMPEVGDRYPYSIVSLGPTTPPLDKNGQGVHWNFKDSEELGTRVDSFFELEETPLAYRFLFDSPLDPEYQADHALKRPDDLLDDPALPIEFEDRYDYYRKTASHYELLGFGVRVDGIPAAAKFDPKDSVYHLPLQYGNSDSSYAKLVMDEIPNIYYQQERWRADTVDGSGTLITPFESYECLRIKTRLRIRDSLKSDSLGIEDAVFRPEEVIYRWVAEEEGVPLMRVVTRNGIVERAEYWHSLYMNTYEGGPSKEERLRMWPNPAREELHMEFGERRWNEGAVLDLRGKLLKSFSLDEDASYKSLRLEGIPEGVHILRLKGAEGVRTERFVKRK